MKFGTNFFRGSMAKGSIRYHHKSMQPDEQHRWLTANVILSTLLAVGMMAMAMVGGSATKREYAGEYSCEAQRRVAEHSIACRTDRPGLTHARAH
jgi:hypothetical protein